MAESAVSLLIEYLGPLLAEEVTLLEGVRGEARKIRDELESMRSFLRDADAREDSNEGIKTWVKQVREAAFDIEDVLDQFMLRLAAQKQQQHDAHGDFGFLRKAVCSIKQLKARHQIAKEIQDVRTQLEDISKRRNDYNLVEQGSSSNSLNNRAYDPPRLDALFIEESQLLGIDGPKNELTGWLLNEEQKLSTISVVGMGGLGKTTLVKKVYEQVKTKFDTYAWITVSQTFTAKDLLQRTATEFYKAKQPPPPSRLDALTDVELIQMLREYLQDQRYVLVLDDVWSTDAWKFICNALPAAQEHGSRVIVTTRDNDVASFCHVGTSHHIHNLEPLGQENAWSLFCRKAFPFDEGNTCPPHLKELSESFVRKCRGLPLAIVTLAGLLSIKEQRYAEWDMIAHSLGTELEDNDNLKSMNRIIMLSYNEIPYHLKSCFLYLSIFPEDYVFKRSKLIRLWIAEGFVEQKDSQRSSEEVAESYLNTLIARSLIQVAESKSYRKVISCRVHDIVREIIISKFSKEQLFASLPSQNTASADRIRRLSVCSNIENAPEYESFSRLRSLFFFWERRLSIASVISSFSGLRLLRVVDLENVCMETFPDDLTNLFYLRYLSLENSEIKSIPNTVGKLKNLETLNLKRTLVHELPVEILKLQRLRHLLVYCQRHVCIVKRGIKVPVGIGNLTSLQKLAYVKATESEIVRELGNLIQLRRLGVTELRREDGCDFCTSVKKMKQLQSLNVRSMNIDEVLDLQSLSYPPFKTTLQHLYLKGRLETLPQWLASLQNLVVLRLLYSRLKDDPLKTLQSLPYLVELILEHAYDGEELCCEAEGYPRLKELYLEDLEGLKQVRVEKGALSCLEKLRISGSTELLEMPLWLGHLTNIKELRLQGLQESFTRSLYKEGLHEEGVRADFVQHIPNIFDGNKGKWT